jgi:hypothetical protein
LPGSAVILSQNESSICDSASFLLKRASLLSPSLDFDKRITRRTLIGYAAAPFAFRRFGFSSINSSMTIIVCRLCVVFNMIYPTNPVLLIALGLATVSYGQ